MTTNLTDVINFNKIKEDKDKTSIIISAVLACRRLRQDYKFGTNLSYVQQNPNSKQTK